MNVFLRSCMAIVFFALVFCDAGAADFTNRDLMLNCAAQTTVFNKSGDVVGRKIESYCRGYLESALHALSIQDRDPCSPRNPVTPEYLLSVYESYLRDASVSPDQGAARTLRVAFFRAFDCGK